MLKASKAICNLRLNAVGKLCLDGCSLKTIHRKIDTVEIEEKSTFPCVANVLMDTTYFGRKFCVMVFKDSITRQILCKQYVKQETNKLYLNGVEEITRRGIKI